MSLGRAGCCAIWPKPCPYHEGVLDAVDAMRDLAVGCSEELADRLLSIIFPPPGPEEADA